MGQAGFCPSAPQFPGVWLLVFNDENENVELKPEVE
jgi:hypothetical protein